MKRTLVHQLRVVRVDDARALDIRHDKPAYVGRGVLGMTEQRLSRKVCVCGARACVRVLTARSNC